MHNLRPRALGLLTALLAALCSSCSEGSGTGGKRVAFELQVHSDVAAGESFTTARGWELVFSRAALALGPIYLWREPPPVAIKAPTLWRRVLDQLVPSAHAHAGDDHFAGGEVKGEYTGQFLFDAVSNAPLAFGPLRGSAGVAQSFSVVLDPPRPGVDDGRLQGHHAFVVGEARRDGELVPFFGGIDIGREGSQRLVDGIQTAVELSEGARVALTVNVRRWFEDADFESLNRAGADPAQGLEITQDSQVHTAWFIGLRSFDAFSMQLVQ